jgi:hypothetical protein
MSTYAEDKAYGKLMERGMYRFLKRFFGKTLRHNDDEFAPFDFEDCDVAVEMKSRKMRSNDWPTTMIKTLKVERCANEPRDCYFIFNFTDKMLYIRYDADQFAKYERRLMKIAARPDKAECWEWRTFIPLADLTTLKTFAAVPCLID